jgi:hypothetical protein
MPTTTIFEFGLLERKNAFPALCVLLGLKFGTRRTTDGRRLRD